MSTPDPRRPLAPATARQMVPLLMELRGVVAAILEREGRPLRVAPAGPLADLALHYLRRLVSRLDTAIERCEHAGARAPAQRKESADEQRQETG